jgi:glutathione S-transferase
LKTKEIFMIKIYGFPYTRSTRATWALEEAGAEYEFIPVNLAKGHQYQLEFLKVNPGGKVPALVDNDFVLTESAAICTYIGERFPASGLVPFGINDRAHYFQWCFFTMSELETPLWTMTKHTKILPKERRIPAVADSCIWEFQRAATVLAKRLEDREFIVGAQFTAADILLGATLNWARKAEIQLMSAVLEAYADRMADRPALLRAREREAKTAAG